MLEPILKGLVEWIYQMMVDIMAYASGELIGVMSMDLSYFERTAPVISEIVNVFIALGWALLLGNLVFQLLKVIMSGAGFEAEDPKILFLRTFAFAFLLLASKQICQIGSSMTGTVISMLNLPASIDVTIPSESMFSMGGGAKWLLVIIIGVVLMVQMIKLLFEIGERYVITSVLTFFSPLAFSMGGSRNTNDIFKGWCRMYASMLVMMLMNIVFLKLIMSAMSKIAAGGVLVWIVFVVALTRVARKIDSHIGKIGLNPAQTGSGIGSRLPGVITMMAVRVMTGAISRSMSGTRGNSGKNGSMGGRGPGANRRGSRFGGAYSGGGHTTNNNANSTTANNTGESRASYNGSGGNKKVNNAPRTDSHGRPNANNMRLSAPIISKTSQATQNGNVGSVLTTEKNTQNVRGKGPSHKSEVPHGGSMARPPLPRNSVGANTPTGNPVNGIIQGSRQNTQNESVGNTHISNNTPKITPTATPPARPSRNANKNTPAGVSDGGNHPISVPDVTQKHTDVRESHIVGGNASISRVNVAKSGDNIDEVSINGNTQRHSGQFNPEHFGGSHESGYVQKPGRTGVSEQRINHEYKNGKHNPAAANKKTGNTFYQKEDLKRNMSQTPTDKRKRGENDRKHKQ